MKKILFICIVGLILVHPTFPSVQPRLMNSAEIQLALKKLQVLGSVLYIAAHPDDENTSVLSWLGREKLMRTGYLSITRGGGGQNLIGTEKGPLMSALRTYELLAARRIDGAKQFFTRAIDFGYSKTASESISIWNRDKVLEDIVFVIRWFKPDIILSRFPPNRGGHGHHSASAILAMEAFKTAGDSSRFAEQLKYVSVWQPRRLFWNTWRPRMQNFKKEELKNLIQVDVGTFNPLLGKSYSEIAAHSRSMHKSQGFGVLARRGHQSDYYALLAGDPAKGDLFSDINTSWTRVAGSRTIQSTIAKAIQTFNPRRPDRILPLLIKTHAQLKKLPPGYWRNQKEKELLQIIQSCAGLWLEAIASTAEVMPGQQIKVKTTVINRSSFPLTLVSIIAPGSSSPLLMKQKLANNQPFAIEVMTKINTSQFSHPYWLREEASTGTYHTSNHRHKGQAIAPYPFNVKFVVRADNREMTLSAPILYRWRDPVQGEQYQSLVVTPPVSLNFEDKVVYFATQKQRTVKVKLRSGPVPVAGKLTLQLPKTWTVQPSSIPFKIGKAFSEQTLSLSISPPAEPANCTMKAVMSVAGKTYHYGRTTIQYTHIPKITLHPKAQAYMVRVKIKGIGGKIAYIMGSGDEIPRYLHQVGFQVDLLSDNDVQNGNLKQYKAIITGIRAYNTRNILQHSQQRLLAYVAAGGRIVMQYNVSRRLKVPELGPFPFKLSRNRVTEESAAITFVKPDHAVLNEPNKISASDFEGWVQERGLYFAGSWDKRYATILACHDSGEKAQEGGLLYCTHGQGVFIYTGFSFFRQLPAAVPGALRLLVNLITSGREDDQPKTK